MVINISSSMTLLFMTTGSKLLWEMGTKACEFLQKKKLHSFKTITGLLGQLVFLHQLRTAGQRIKRLKNKKERSGAMAGTVKDGFSVIDDGT